MLHDTKAWQARDKLADAVFECILLQLHMRNMSLPQEGIRPNYRVGSMNLSVKSACIAFIVAILGVTSGQSVSADPAPGFEFDPAKLEAKMDACMEYQSGEQDILMGWANISTGDIRQWRCSSLRHMLLDIDDRPAHDPYVNIPDFMRCAVSIHG